ncbi:hypothetical protein Tco_1007108, partial [Tanacetum coccineum]
QKKDVIQYPRFTKLIIADLMQNSDSIPKRLEEEYHSIKDDVPLVSVYTTRNVTIKGMLIPDEFLTDDIHATLEYKDYEKVFLEIDIPTIQSQPNKKRKQVVRETGSLRKSLKVIIKQKKLSTTPIPPPSDDKERDEITKATLLSLASHKTAKIAEEQENVAAVEEHLLNEDVEKIVEGKDKESYASAFADSAFQDDAVIGTRLEPASHKENSKTIDDDDVDDKDNKKKDDDNDDDDNDDHNDHALARNKVTCSSKIRKEKMQTPIPSPPTSPRTDLSSDKTISHELMANVSPTPDTTSQDPSKSKRIYSKYKHIPGALHMICRRQGFMIKQMEKKFIASNATNDIIEDNLPRVIANTIIKEMDTFLASVPALISKEFDDHAPKIIEELLKNQINNNLITIYPTTSTSTVTTSDVLKRSKSASGSSSKQQAQGYNTYVSELQQQKQEWNAWIEKTVINEDEVIPEDETPKLIEEF